ncbi:hypothetical protein LPJ66_000409 [Kickxella alabastrina]|uniref:Uncharacterized protein n=1 Tax=Kickxella alabastrina TaxID=61397 RepID=A0ACC1IW30_9FUNG|nr:hypothetical protein LPJ66_000409 [Kickxella alabastrina]
MYFTQAEQTAFKQFDAYDFNGDSQFQSGLATIPNSSDSLVIEKAKLFYYSRAVSALDHKRYFAWKAKSTDNAASVNDDDEANSSSKHPPSIPFAEVVGMITRGEEVPGIRQIADKLNHQIPSQSTTKAPPKPWEIQHQDDTSQQQ